MTRFSPLLAAALFLLPACGADAPAPAPAAEAAAPATAAADQAPEAATVLTSAAPTDGLAEMPMDEVEAKLAAGDCAVFDANSPSTREANGVIEGAILLANYREYDVAALPDAKDANVVFYCGSTLCTASDKAAVRATAAGYTNVKVMREGIKGWKKAGKKTVEWAAPAPAESSAI